MNKCPKMEPRLPDNERDPNGMLESNRDFIFHNSEWLEWCEKHSDLIALAPQMAEVIAALATGWPPGTAVINVHADVVKKACSIHAQLKKV